MTTEPQFGPIPGDTTGEQIMAMFDANSQEWILSAEGDYQTGGVEVFRYDGSDHQRLIALEWPGRKNHSDEKVTVRLFIHPDDALGLAKVLTHTAWWMKAAERGRRRI